MSERQELLCKLYGDVLLAELQAQDIAGNARTAFKSAQMVQIQQGYDDEEISGKNQTARDRSEFLYLDGSPNLYEAQAALAEAEHQAALSTIKRKTVEANIGLEKARLYSLARIG